MPGLAVRGYAVGAARALTEAGYAVELEDPPGWANRADDLAAYGRDLATRLTGADGRVDVLVGLSVGTQAAAMAAMVAAGTGLVGRLLLISPTVPPELRTRTRLAARFLRGEDHPDSPTWRSQVPDWRRAGVRRIARVFDSALKVRLEDILASVTATLTVVHAEADQLSTLAYGADLATRFGGHLVVVPDAPHSWPVGDPDRFVGLVDQLMRSDS